MSDSWQMYGDLMSAFVRAIPRSVYGDVRRLMPLAWAVVVLSNLTFEKFFFTILMIEM